MAEAQPAAPLPDYHWRLGQFFDPAWGHNWDQGRCTTTASLTVSRTTKGTGTGWAPGP